MPKLSSGAAAGKDLVLVRKATYQPKAERRLGESRGSDAGIVVLAEEIAEIAEIWTRGHQKRAGFWPLAGEICPLEMCKNPVRMLARNSAQGTAGKRTPCEENSRPSCPCDCAS